MPAELQVARKTNIFRDLKVDFEELALIVSYGIETEFVDQNGNPAGVDVAPGKKRIRLKSIDKKTDIPALADAIMRSCDIIPAKQSSYLIELLYEIQHTLVKEEAGGASNDQSSAPGARQSSSHQRSSSSRAASLNEAAEAKEGEGNDLILAEQAQIDSGAVSINDIDSYLEALYEDDLEKKTEGARKLLILAQRSEYIIVLIQHQSLMGALARVLRDEYRKSTSLTLLIIQIFFCAAHFKEFHPVVINNRIGDMCMRIVDLEHRRYVARVMDIDRLSTLAKLQAKGDEEGEKAFRKVDAEARQREAADESHFRGPKKSVKNTNEEAKDEKSDDKDSRPVALKPLPPGKVDINKEHRKFINTVRRSDGLNYCCLHILLNLAEDLDIERKMCKRGIVTLLIPLLDSDNAYLLLLVVNFLRKLSIFEENKDAMVAHGAGSKLVSLLPSAGRAPSRVEPNDVRCDLYASILHLMFNLTFDVSMCQAFLAAGALAKVGALLRAAPFRAPGLKLLYRLSTDYVARGMFAGTDAVAYTVSMVAKFPQARLPPELGALAVNLSMHQQTAELLCVPATLRLLLTRLLKTRDPIIAKVLRGIAQFTYGVQADAELKAHAMEDLRRELAINNALLAEDDAAARKESERAKAREKERKDKAKERARRRKSAAARASAEVADEKVSEDQEEPESAVVASASTSSAKESAEFDVFAPEPNEPIDYDYPQEGLWAPLLKDIIKLLRVAELRVTDEQLVKTDAEGNVLEDPAVGGAGAMPPEAPESGCLLTELLGILASMTQRDFASSSLPMHAAANEEVLGVIMRALNPATNGGQDDVLLEALQALSAFARDPASAAAIARTPTARLLSEVLQERGGDLDIAMQCVTCVARLLFHPPTRASVISSRLPMILAEVVDLPIERLAAEADDCLYIIIECLRYEEGLQLESEDTEAGEVASSPNGQLWRALQMRRFRAHNRQWVEMCDAVDAGGEEPPLDMAAHGEADDGEGDADGDGDYGNDVHHGESNESLVDAHGSPHKGHHAATAGSPPGAALHSQKGEAITLDVSFLFEEAQRGAAGTIVPRDLVASAANPGVGALFDYAEDAYDLGPEHDTEIDDVDDDVEALMNQYMQSKGLAGGMMGNGIAQNPRSNVRFS